MKKLKILCFFGTRPEAIKMAPVIQVLEKEKRFQVVVGVSAQHRGMLDQVLDLFHIRCQVDLNLMKEGQSLFDVTADVLRKFERVLDQIKPDLVLVHGDTTTTMAGSLASFYKKIPVGHVEAGLRTGDKYRPFPEEINRHVTDSVATLYFAPTNKSKKNLLDEQIDPHLVFVTGNTVIDALLETAEKPSRIKSAELQRALTRIGRQEIILMTAHRRENFGAPFVNICTAVRNLSRRFPSIHWIYPVHPNPNVIKPAHRYLSSRPNIHLVSPLDYADLVKVMKKSKLVVTDSGGIQEEAPSLGKPVLVLRDVTERPEAVQAGTVKIVGTNRSTIERAVSKLLTDRRAYRKMSNAVNPYGDGHAAERISQAIRWYFGLSRTRPSPFRAGKV
jgi:UDP-N-acetylglucosamine 2-epimerase (non-hydrolysing)